MIARHVVAIVVDPEFGDRVDALLERLPVWIADTAVNRAALDRWRSTDTHHGQTSGHTGVGAATTFSVDLNAASEAWVLDVMDTVAGHHDHYSQTPGYSALEIYGATPSPLLLKALAVYRLIEITLLPGGFCASTRDGAPAGTPND